MAGKIVIHKVTADGEQLSQEISVERHHYEALNKGISLLEQFRGFFNLADDRMKEVNDRIRAADYYQRKLGKISPEAAMLVAEIWDTLHGRKSGAATQAVLEQDKLERQIEIARLQEEREAIEAGKSTPLPDDLIG